MFRLPDGMRRKDTDSACTYPHRKGAAFFTITTGTKPERFVPLLFLSLHWGNPDLARQPGTHHNLRAVVLNQKGPVSVILHDREAFSGNDPKIHKFSTGHTAAADCNYVNHSSTAHFIQVVGIHLLLQ